MRSEQQKRSVEQKTSQQWWKKSAIICGLVVGFVIGVWLLPEPHYTTGFRTLSELQAHASTLDEWIKMENDNELLPSYDRYYKKTFTRTVWKLWKEKFTGLCVRLRLIKQPPFSPHFFKTILEHVAHDRIKRGWDGNFIQKFEVKPTSKIVVFGVVQGAYHSFVRDLTELKRLGIINEQLQVLQPDYYIVFLGNVVNRSPYTLDTCGVVLRLLEENPENVIYLRGTNEFFDYWKDHTLKRELEMRCKYVSSEKIPLATEVNHFFDTLPLTVYATMPTWSSEEHLHYIRIAPFVHPPLAKKLDEKTYAQFLLEGQQHSLDYFDCEKRSLHAQPEAEHLLLRAVVKDILKRDYFEKTDGLRLIEPTEGVITWNIISAPTESYRSAFNFSYDAFAIISFEKYHLLDSTIALHANNMCIVKNKGFFTKENLFFR